MQPSPRPRGNQPMRPYESAGIEPDLRDILSDPVVHAVMRRDAVGEDEIRATIRAARVRLGLVAACELVIEDEAWPQSGKARMPAIAGARDGAVGWIWGGRCHLGPLR